MPKINAVCSLLMAMGISTLIVGCEPAAKTGTKPAAKSSSGAGSTTGGGVEVPAAAPKGAAETPKADAPAAEPKAEAPAVEAKPEAPAAEEKKEN